MHHRPIKFNRASALVAAAAVALSCQQVPPPAPSASLPVSAAEAKARLSGRAVSDYSHTLIGAASRWHEGSRRVQAFGDPATAAWTGGVPLSSLGCTGSDLGTNGAAIRNMIPGQSHRLFVITREGKFLDLDPADPTVSPVVTPLGGTFSKTYVALSGNGRVAFVVSDAGLAHAIDLESVVAGAHPTKSLNLCKACLGGALFADPLASSTSSSQTTLYTVANDGYAFRLGLTAGAFAGAAFTKTDLPKVTAISSPLTGTELVKAPPIALGGVLFVGDRRGNLNRFDTASSVLTSWTIDAGWPIESPVSLDVDDSLAPTDAFIGVGPRLHWLKLASGTRLSSLYALVENKGPLHGAVTAANQSSYLTTNTTTLTASNAYKTVSLYKNASSDAVTLPGLAGYLDDDRLTHCEYITGQPPDIDASIGPTGRSYANFTCWSSFGDPPAPSAGAGISPPVADGTALASAHLQGPVGIDVMDDGSTYPADDGSVFIGDSDHCQVLFKPATPDSGKKWASSGVLAGSLDPSKVYVFAGTLNGDGVWNASDIGNGQGGPIKTRPTRLQTPGQPPRGTPLNLIFGLAVGNLGVYISQLNKNTSGTYKDGAVLFVPRVGVTSAYGMSVTPGEMYVLTTAGNFQGLAIDRVDPTKDVLYIASFDWGGASNTNRIMRMDSTSSADASTFASGLSRPVDVCLDDMGNLFTAESTGNRVSMFWDTRGLGASNTRLWNIATPVANTRYTVASGLNSPQTVTFALNDPTMPSGCLYMGNTGNHTIVRMDETGTKQTAAGTGTGGDTGDGGLATAAKLNYPHRAKGDGRGTTYVCDRYNNRIRVLTSPAGAGAAQGYMRFDLTSLVQRAIYSATLTLTSQTDTAPLAAPLVGLADTYLAGTTTEWTDANLTPTKAPAIDLGAGLAVPAAASWNFEPDSTHDYTLPAAAIPYVSATDALTQTLRLGIKSPVDATNYYYPTGVGLPTNATKSPDFHTHKGAAGKRPKVVLTHGTVKLSRSIMSQPVIHVIAGKRYVFIANANTLFRFDATDEASFTASCDFALATTGRTAGGTVYSPDNSFQPNPAPPLVNFDGRAYMLDIKANTTTSYSYTLNAFDGNAADASGLWLNTSRSVAAGVASTYDDNAGIYISAGGYSINEAYLGLGDKRLYRLTL